MDTPREWLEVSGPSVDVAVAAALTELGLESPDQVSVEVIQEGKRGVLGLGGREAIVKVSPLPAKRRRRRRRRRSGSGGEESASDDRQSREQTSQGQKTGGGGQRQRSGGGGNGGRRQSQRGDGGGGQQGRNKDTKSSNDGRDQAKQRNSRNAGAASGGSRSKNGRNGSGARENTTKDEAMSTADISEQADVAKEFLEGLLDAFGLEGAVTTKVDEDDNILFLDVAGEQTEALVGSRGAIMTSVLEITRTVVQRKTFGAPRMRLDIAGYAERRRTALTIYASNLADKVKGEGNEVMLEPMNPADRKVVHDAVGEIEGVRSYSEGEDPTRAVVIAPD